MADIEKVIKGLNDISGFIAGRIGFEQAKNFLLTIDDAVEMLKEQKQIVLCKDCKKRGTEECPVCMSTDRNAFSNWFCADGERKDDG